MYPCLSQTGEGLHTLSLPHLYFCYCFLIIPPLPYSICQRLVNFGPQAKFGLRPIFVNKFLLKHSHSHSLMYDRWLHLCYSPRAECKRDSTHPLRLQNPKYLLSSPLQKKSADLLYSQSFSDIFGHDPQ